MDPPGSAAERHQRLLDLFFLAIGADQEQRTTLLNAACAGDAQLRRDIDLLLAADTKTMGLLDRPAYAAGGSFALECPQCLTCFDAGPETCPVDGAALQPAFEGTLLIDGRYRVEKRLGRGGMGAVYRALHIGLDKRFALKMIRSGPILTEVMRERFRREGRALGRFKHPHIVDVTDAGVDAGGRPYLVMELLEGSSLQGILQSEGPLPIARALPILRAVAEAIDTAHRQKVIHGDIKPGNVFIPSDGGVKILDFGLAELLDTGQERGGVMGTPAYMTSAVLQGAPVTEAADHHALAVLAYELLTGDVPYGRKPAEVVAGQKQPPRALSAMNPKLPVELDAPAADGLQQRFDTALNLVIPLEAAWRRVSFRRWVRREVPIRFAFAMVLALLMAPIAGWLATTDAFRTAEVRTRDFRFGLRPDRPPDPRLLLVSIDDATLAADPAPLMARADEAGERLERIFAGNPAAVGVDLLLPVQWSRSPAFQQLILRHAQNLRLALLSGQNGETTGVESISPMAAGVLGRDATAGLFAFVNFATDHEGSPDGSIRRARYSYRDVSGSLRPSLASAVAGKNQTSDEMFWLDQSIRWQDLPRISWKDLDRVNVAEFRGRLVFVGAEFPGSGDEGHRVPARAGRKGEITGLALQALTAATILEGSPIFDLSGAWMLVRRGLLLALPAALFLCAPRALSGGIAAWGAVVASLAIDLAIFRFHAVFVSMAIEYTTVLIMLGLVSILRRIRPPSPA